MGRLVVVSVMLFFSCTFVNGQDKLSPKLKASTKNRISQKAKEKFLVQVKKSEDFLHQYKDEITIINEHRPSSTFAFVAPYEIIIDKMIDDENVLFIDIRHPPMEESFLKDPNFKFNRIRKVQNEYPTVAGLGFVVSIKERKYDPADIDLRGKSILIGLEGEAISQHATDMATIIAGAGNTSPLYKGIATKAKLSSSDFNNLLPDNENLLAANNIFVQNHAYGVGIENYYGVEAAAYDQSVYDKPELLHVFSAGNSGTLSPDEGIYAGLTFANLTGNFKQAKNILTVSAVDTTLTLNEFNSKGPAYDGRLKPELTAYGGRGTSDAAAIVSGVSVLLQQAYFNVAGTVPEISLTKSLLIAGADDIGSNGIDYYTGYGNVNAFNSLQALDSGWYREVNLAKGETASFDIDIPDGVSEMRLAVCWTDPPALINSSNALINDVEARLVYNEEGWLPWVLNSNPTNEALNAPAERKEDHLNNTEFFTLGSPLSGEYTVHLDGVNLATKDQKVNVAWFYYPSDQFTWDFPTATDFVVSGSKEPLYWSSSFANINGVISYRIGNGDWIELNNNWKLGDTYSWNVPDTSAFAQLKMTIGTETFISDAFLISEVPQVSVAFNCEDNFGLQWQEIENASAYVIYEMGEELLQLIGTTSGTKSTIPKSSSVFYSVAPVIDGAIGLRGPAINYAFQGAFCYINFFAAERFDDESVKLSLSLSTSSAIEKITILKSFNDIENSIIHEFAPQGGTSFALMDYELYPGAQQYQAILYFEDGSILESEVSQIFIEAKNKAIFFPNPVSDIHVNILSSGNGQRIQVFDRSGKIILEKVLLSTVDYIPIHDLRAGLYLYQLLDGNKIIDSGKFIKY